MDALPPEPEKLLFEATVKPHRSLSRKGMMLVVAFLFAGSLTVTSLMFLLGAWPVIGFNGADLLLALFLLRLNVRAARAREIITLSAAALRIKTTDLRGRSWQQTLPPYWLKVSLQERPGTVPKLLLSSRGGQTEVARQLGETEKRDLAAALTGALARLRSPRFDNPQLRETV
jgi:uncharacterized membrane protein